MAAVGRKAEHATSIPTLILNRRPQLRQNVVVKMDRNAAVETSVRIRDLDDEMKQDDIAFGKLKREFEEQQRTYQQNHLEKSKLRAELDQKLRSLILQRNTSLKNTATAATTSKKRQSPENVKQDERNQQGNAGHEEGGNGINLSHFHLISTIGQGTQGTVFLARKIGGQDNNKLYAIKKIKKSRMIKIKEAAKRAKNERQVLEAIGKRPFLVSMHYAFQTKTELYLVLDYICGGELLTHLDARLQSTDDSSFTEDEVRIFIAEIVIAIEQLHKLGIVYRDLKLENVLLDSDGHVVLTDFGLSEELTEESNYRSSNFCGTAEYMAPEIVCNKGYSFSVDWWALGVLFYELLTGYTPFPVDENTKQNSFKQIKNAKIPMLDSISKDAKSLIRGLLEKDPLKRLGSCRKNVEQIKAHAFFNGIDWKKIERKEITPLFKPPTIKHEEDTSNFCEKFTKMAIANEPSDSLSNHVTLERWSFDNASTATTQHMEGARKRSALPVEDTDMMSKNRRMFR